jgi:hypothetical protein
VVPVVANEKKWADWAGESTSPLLDDGLLAGLALLWRAYIRAQAVGANAWDFDLRTGRLYLVGMTSSALRWMVAKGFAKYDPETSGYSDAERSPRRSDGHSFDERTSLILTPRGAELAERVFGKTARWPQATLYSPAAVADEAPALANESHAAYEINQSATPAFNPRWNATRRELSLGGRIVKRFRVPAQNQERILSVFEEESWAEHIHDPLPATYDIDAPTRLHDAINRLNRCQINPLLRFRGDGRGTGVLWELRQPSLSV